MPLHLTLSEVAAGPGFAAVPYLLALAGLLVCLGLIVLVKAFIETIAYLITSFVGKLPFAGAALAKVIRRAEQALTNILGRAERSIDSYIAYCWHNLAIVIRWTAREIERLGYLALVAAAVDTLHISPRQAKRLINALLHPIRTAQLIYAKVMRLLHVAVHGIRRTVVAGVMPRLGVLGGEIEHVIEWDLPRLRARDRAIARRVQRAFDWIKAHRKTVVTTAFVGAVAVALGRLGAGWVRCKNWKRIGRHVCGLPLGLIEALLGLGFGVFLFENFCTLIGKLAGVAAKVLPPMIAVLAAPAAALCDGKHTQAAALPLNTTALPSVADPLPL